MADDDEIARESEDIRLQIAHARAALYDRAKLQREARRQYAREYYAKHREEHARVSAAATSGAAREGSRRVPQEEQGAEPAVARQAQGRGQREDPREVSRRPREAPCSAVGRSMPRTRRRIGPAGGSTTRRTGRSRTPRSRAWRDREKRRREVGLPARRIHRTRREERFANTAAADAFFDRSWTDAELVQALKSIATPPEVWAAWKRDCLRARAAYHLAEQKEELARLQKELGRARARTETEAATDTGGDRGSTPRGDRPPDQRAPPTPRTATPTTSPRPRSPAPDAATESDDGNEPMTTTTSEGPTMIDRSDCEATLYRIAICAFTYYPDKEADEPGYSVDEDVDWCLAPLAAAQWPRRSARAEASAN